MESTNMMLQFLVDNKVGDEVKNEYWQNLVIHGFDDYEYFLNMSESDIKEMCDLCGITKFVHVKKVLTGWKLLAMKAADVNLVSDSVESRVVAMPEAVSNLLSPKPTDDMQEYFNVVVKEVFESSFELFNDVPSFVKYVKGQRQLRFDIHKKTEEVLQCISALHNENSCRNWVNVRMFSDNNCTIRSQVLYQAKNTLKFLSVEMQKLRGQMGSLRNRKALLYSQRDMPLHQVNELSFYDMKLKLVT